MQLELWAVVVIVSAVIALLLCLVVCCVSRCFRPENSRGTAWFPAKDGSERLVPGAFDRPRGAVVPAPGGAA
jgi:hypothetical protein